MKEEEIIVKKFEESATEMLRSLKEDALEEWERYEWFGYIRGVRDCAYDCGVLSKTTIQEKLEEALKIITNK
jgi:DNA-binding NtrC family response regulator